MPKFTKILVGINPSLYATLKHYISGMQATRLVRFGMSPVVLGGRQPFGLKPTQTRKSNDRQRRKIVSNTYSILRKYKQPKQWSGLAIPFEPYYPPSIVPGTKE